MAPGKFGLFKGRSRECAEPPSTENLLNSCTDSVTPSSPQPSTSQGLFEDQSCYKELSMLHLDSDDEDDSERPAFERQPSVSSKIEEPQVDYNQLCSTNSTSATTLQDTQDQDQDYLQDYEDYEDQDYQNYDLQKFELATPDDATSIDANSLQFDQTSLVSDDVKYCGASSKKLKKIKAKEEQKLQEQKSDNAMWLASDYEVIQRLLARNCTLDELIKWEAIATARGLCTLTATCTCGDCNGGRAPPAVTDGDAGIGAAPLLGAVSVGCLLM